MRRLLRSTGLALGLPFIVALVSSCADYATSTRSANVVRASAGPVNALTGPQVVISQIYGGGGNTGATLKNDFIELHNRGTTPVAVDGWSVQYASAAGSTWSRTNLAGTIQPGRYYLVQQAPGSGGTQSLPTPEATGTITMGATGGKVALVAGTALVTGTCPTAVVDIVGFGAANCGTTAAPGNTTAVLRKDAGCAYTGVTQNDFVVGAPAPRNGATPAVICEGDDEQPVVDDVTIDAVNTTIEVGQTRQLTAHAFAAGVEVSAAFAWSAAPAGVVSVSAAGLVTAQTPGTVEVRATTANGVFEAITFQVNEATLPNLPIVRFSEVHYDNFGTDVGEALEIEGPAGTDLTGWQVVLYNGGNGQAYDTRVLTQTIPATCSPRGVVVLAYEQDGVQNGSPDGFALVNAAGELVEFLSYEGAFTASTGPAAGKTSVNIGVQQSSAPHFQTLQRRPSGIWEGPKASTLGGCHGSTPVTPVNQISFSGRVPFDAPLPVGFEDQIFADVRSPTDADVPGTITWTTLAPDIATIDSRGVIHALAPGKATFRATHADGTMNTYSLPMAVATSGSAVYGNHTEFGEPVDSDASDDFIVRRTEFTSSFNRKRNIPNWVSYNLETTHIASGQDRCDCFTYDPELPASFTRYTTADYTGAGAAAGHGIDRGHLARSFDRTSGSLDNARTFYFSNIIPQTADNNQGPWASFENYLGALATNDDKELYIVTGASGSRGTVKNEGVITIPTHVWKVAVIMPRNHGLANVDSFDDVEIIAVIMPNEPGIRNVNWNTYRATVNAVETLSGYDVLSLLPDDVEGLVESGLQEGVALASALAAGGSITEGNANSLAAKLSAASASIERRQHTPAANQLRAFLNEVQAMERSGRLGATDANALRAIAQRVLATL